MTNDEIQLRIPYKDLNVGLCEGNNYEYQKIVRVDDRYVYYIGPCGSILHRYDKTAYKDVDNHPMYWPVFTYYSFDSRDRNAPEKSMTRHDIRVHCIQDAAYYDGRFYVVSYYTDLDGQTKYLCTSVDENLADQSRIDFPWTIDADHLYSIEPVAFSSEFGLSISRRTYPENLVAVYDPDGERRTRLTSVGNHPWTVIDTNDMVYDSD